MTTTAPATTARIPLQLLRLPVAADLQRRPAGKHLTPLEDLDEAHFERESLAQWTAQDPTSPAAQHGRRCACCRPALADAEVAS